MAEGKTMRLGQVARKLNVGISTIADALAAKGFDIESKPNAKIDEHQFKILLSEFESSVNDKREASGLTIGQKHIDNVVIDVDSPSVKEAKKDDEDDILITGMTSKDLKSAAKKPEPKPEPKQESKPVEAKKPEPVEPEKPTAKKEEAKPEPAEKPVTAKEEKPSTPKEPEAKPEAAKPEVEAPKEKKGPVAEAPKEEKKEEKPKPTSGLKILGKIELDSKGRPKAQKKVAPKETPKATEPEKAATPAEVPKSEKEKEKAEAPVQDSSVKETTKTEAEDKTPKETEIKSQEATTASANPAKAEVTSPADDKFKGKADTLKGLTVLGKIELPEKKKKSPVASSDSRDRGKRKRKRVRLPGKPGAPSAPTTTARGSAAARPGDARRGAARPQKEEVTDKQIQEQIKATLAKLSGGSGGKSNSRQRSKYRRDKRSAMADARDEHIQQQQSQSKTLKVTEFISANDLASLMNVSVNEVISTCMSLGMFVSINQRLDAESITVIADEFNFDIEFTDTEDETEVEEVVDSPEDLTDRAPIVTIMGHVDHGKTSLLDYIREANVTAGEAGGITQHIGAYDVMTTSGKRVAFLDTPGHEAFTAMRARGAKVTDIVIIVVAADDGVKPQTKEALNHAQVAGVPIVIAINKIDRPGANPDRIREELSANNILVEEWGGKYQCQEISAKTGQGVSDLLEKVLLEAEVLELKANADKPAVGTVIEAMLDKGRGYVTTVLVQAGVMRIGDVMLAGSQYGKVKAMYDHRGNRVKEAGPSTPVQVLGLDGAPQAGDRFNVMESDREAREIATKREQILREQSIRTKKHITLDEIGRRLAIGSFKELNVIVKGDVDGSVEALSDSLLKLSTEEVQVNIIHKGVGAISESDVLLASASDAVVIGFQVRPSPSAKRLSEQEEIEVRLYSIIYDAINDVKDAMEGMLAPTVEEFITGNVEVREVFKITKVGTVAGCYVTDGFIKRNSKMRLIRDGIVVHSGQVSALKRFKDDVAEVRYGYECGISIKNYNDILEGDIIEGFDEREVKRKL